MKFQDTFDYFENKYTELTHDKEVVVENKEPAPLAIVVDNKQTQPEEEAVEQIVHEDEQVPVEDDKPKAVEEESKEV